MTRPTPQGDQPSRVQRTITAVRHRWKALGRRGQWLTAGVALLLIAAFLVTAFVFTYTGTRTTTIGSVSVSLQHPASWHRHDANDATVLSPLDFSALPPGATPEGWKQIITAMDQDPSTVVGIYIREHTESDFRTGDLATLKGAVAADLTGNRASLRAPAEAADLYIAGERAATLDGQIRPRTSTDSLRTRSYVVPLPEKAGRTVHIMFFGAANAFAEEQEQFAQILESITFTE